MTKNDLQSSTKSVTNTFRGVWHDVHYLLNAQNTFLRHYQGQFSTFVSIWVLFSQKYEFQPTFFVENWFFNFFWKIGLDIKKHIFWSIYSVPTMFVKFLKRIFDFQMSIFTCITRISRFLLKTPHDLTKIFSGAEILVVTFYTS